MRAALAALVAAVVLPLAACSGEDPAATYTGPLATSGVDVEFGPATDSATASPTVTASASPTEASETTTETTGPVGDPCGNLEAAQTVASIAPDRYVSICLGMSFTEAGDAFPGPQIAGKAACPWLADVLAVEDRGLFISAITDPQAPSENIRMFRMTWTGDLDDARTFDAPKTAEGISVGSTRAAVVAAYPDASVVTVDDPALGEREQVVVSGGDGTAIAFDVTDGAVSAVYWGRGIQSGSVSELCAL